MTIALHGDGSSLILEAQEGAAPLWRWWGPRVDADMLPALADTRPQASLSFDRDQPLTLVSTYGTGWFGPATLRAHRGGQAVARWFADVAVKAQADGLTVTLTDRTARVTIAQRIAMAADMLTL